MRSHLFHLSKSKVFGLLMAVSAVCLLLPNRYTQPVRGPVQFLVPFQDAAYRFTRMLADHVDGPTPHGLGTPYHRLSEIDGKVLLLGVDQDRSTFLHTAEELA